MDAENEDSLMNYTMVITILGLLSCMSTYFMDFKKRRGTEVKYEKVEICDTLNIQMIKSDLSSDL